MTGGLGLLVGILSMVTAVLIARSQRRPKNLDYEVSNDTAVVAVDNKRHLSAQDLEVRFRGSSVEAPMLTTVRVRNAGRAAVDERDFDQPIVVHAGRDVLAAWCIAAPIGRVTPEQVVDEDELDLHTGRIPLRPLLLQAGEEVQLQIISDSPDSLHVEVTARIKDESRPIRNTADVKARRSSQLANGVFFVLGLVASVAGTWVAGGNVSDLAFFVGLVAVAVTVSVVITVVLAQLLKKRWIGR